MSVPVPSCSLSPSTAKLTPRACSAEKIKEDYTYVCQDIVKEFKKYDADPYKYFARFAGEHSVTGRVSLASLSLLCSRPRPVGETLFDHFSPRRNTIWTSATNDSSPPKSSSTPRSTLPTSSPLSPKWSTPSFRPPQSMFVVGCTRTSCCPAVRPCSRISGRGCRGM